MMDNIKNVYIIVGIIITACMTILIAVFQWRTNENTRKQNLYDKRWDYYVRTKKAFLSDLSNEVKGNKKDSTSKHLENWSIHNADEAFFLFGKDIENHVRKTAKEILQRCGDNAIEDPVASFRRPFEKYLRVKSHF